MRVAVVTGANRGMGLETVRQLAERGMKVIGTSRDPDKGKAAQAALEKDGVDSAYLPLDVTDHAAALALAERIEKDHGRLDVLINNAGVMLEGPEGSLMGTDLALFGKTFEINTMGAVHCCRAFVPLMKKNDYGRIVNVSSGLGALNDMSGGFAAYRLSKSALNAVTRIVSNEVAGNNIKVNSVCPGHVRTDMGGPTAARMVDEGVDTTIWLATLRDKGPSGGFFRDCKQIDW